MIITDQLLNTNPYSRPGTKLPQIKGIVVHYVGNPATSAQANRNYFNNLAQTKAAYAGAHYIVGLEGEVIRCVPDNEVTYHAGKSYGPKWDLTVKNNNQTLIGIECCHPTPDGKFTEKTLIALIELTADLCRQYHLDAGAQVYRHYDVCGKACPLYFVNHPGEWAALLKKVKEQAAEEQTSVQTVQMMVNGRKAPVNRILKDGRNFVQLSDLADLGLFSLDYEPQSKLVSIQTK